MRILFFILMCFSKLSAAGSVIVLQGTSSAGKSSIAKILQPMLPGKWIVVAVDDFVGPALVKQAIDRGLIHDGMSELECKRVISEHISDLLEKLDDAAWSRINIDAYSYVAQQLRAGNSVILDTVLDKEEFNANSPFVTMLQGVRLFMTCVYCSPFHLAQHTQIRNNSGDFIQVRNLKRVLHMYCDMYVPVSDQENSIDQLRPADFVEDCIRARFGGVGVRVKPAYGAYDCIVNSGVMSLDRCARAILQDFLG